MAHDGPVHVTMPLCRSSRGLPVALLPCSRQLADDPATSELVVADALLIFEGARAREHGTAQQLPSLDPAAWRLVPQAEPGSYVLEPCP